LDRPRNLLKLLDLPFASDASVTKNVSFSIGAALAKKVSSILGVSVGDVSV